MRPAKSLSGGIALAILLLACGDGDITNPTLGDLAGNYTASRFQFTSKANATVRIDLIQFGGSFQVNIASNGQFSGILRTFDPATFQTVDFTVAGIMTIQGNDKLAADFTAGPFSDRTFSFALSGSALTLLDDNASFDFDRDGQNEPAELLIVLRRT